MLRGLNADRVDDPKLKEAIRIAKLDVRKVKEELDSFRYFMRAGITLPTWEGRLKPYPLYTVAAYAGWLSKLPSEHCYAYINCIYALDKGKAM